MKTLPIKEPTLLQTTRCNSCTTYITGICHNKEETVYLRKFPSSATCVWHSSGSEHISKDIGPNCIDRARFNSGELADIKQMFRDGFPVRAIATEYSVTPARIRNHTKDLNKEAVTC